MFVTSAANVALPATVTVHVDAKDESDVATVFTISADFEEAGLNPQNVNFVQTEALTTAGIAVQKYGGLIIPTSKVVTELLTPRLLPSTVLLMLAQLLLLTRAKFLPVRVYHFMICPY